MYRTKKDWVKSDIKPCLNGCKEKKNCIHECEDLEAWKQYQERQDIEARIKRWNTE